MMLKAIFERAVFQWETRTDARILTAIKDRAWKIFLDDKIRFMNEEYHLKLCNDVLNDFDDLKVEEMLEQSKSGEIAPHLQKTYEEKREAVEREVHRKAFIQRNQWCGEIIQILKLMQDLFRKRELAYGLAELKVPERVLYDVFAILMSTTVDLLNIELTPEILKKVWISFAPTKLVHLREAYILDYCTKILGGFEDSQVAEMISDIRKFNEVKLHYLNRIQRLQQLHRLEEANKQLAVTMAEDHQWTSEIYRLLRYNGAFT